MRDSATSFIKNSAFFRFASDWVDVFFTSGPVTASFSRLVTDFLRRPRKDLLASKFMFVVKRRDVIRKR